MKTFFISDTHFGHENVIKFDNRPFKNAAEMESILVRNWNNVVGHRDRIYILGDFCWDTTDEWLRLLKKLNGKKVLILGNHDLKTYSTQLKAQFESISDYKVIRLNGKKIIMSHYPIPFYESSFNKDTYMLFGHIHNNTLEARMMIPLLENMEAYHEIYPHDSNQCNLYHVGCMMKTMDYFPRELEDIIERANIYGKI